MFVDVCQRSEALMLYHRYQNPHPPRSAESLETSQALSYAIVLKVSLCAWLVLLVENTLYALTVLHDADYYLHNHWRS